MEYVFLVYVFLKLNFINTVLTISSIVLIIGIIIGAAAMIVRATDQTFDNDKVISNRWKPTVKIWSWLSIIVFSMYAIIPSREDAAILVATYYTASMVQSAEVQKVITLAKSIANSALDEAITKTQKK